MDIHQLELFLAVMDSPSMTRAAEKVFLSPGAVSLTTWPTNSTPNCLCGAVSG